MFHAFDSAVPRRSMPRADWMALLARAPLALLEDALRAPMEGCRIEWLRRPETGLYMVQGRAGGTGERFNLGEVTVTRCTLRAHDVRGTPSPVGVSYVMGRHHRHAELAAVADALLQQPVQQAGLERALLTPVREFLSHQMAQRQSRAQSTRVDFFTVARESSAGSPEDRE